MVSELEIKIWKPRKREDIRVSALLLDEENPGWFMRLDPRQVTTINGISGCVCHALYGSFIEGIKMLEAFEAGDRNYGRHYGFSCSEKMDLFCVECWHAEILTRRAEARPQLLERVVGKVMEASREYTLAK